MGSYLTRRLLYMIPTLLVVSVIIFSLVRMVPGDIIDQMVAEMAAQPGASGTVDREAIEKRLGLDVPVWQQYGRWLAGVVQGDLGESFRGYGTVADKIASRLPVTFELGLLSIIVGLIIAIPIGIYSAVRQNSIGDYVGRTTAIAFMSVPNFWVGTMIMIYPAVWFRWSPPMEVVAFSDDPIGNLGMFLIPSIVLGMALAGSTMRMTRTMMLEVLRQDFIRTAWSKGLREKVVILRHATRNALIPVVTWVGFQIPMLVGGAVVTETIFGLPGMGRLLVDALSERDYPVVTGVALIVAAFVVLVNLIVDLTYAWLDPRARQE
ncbi:MAG: glutathione ABC transporter permease GsiC [Gammaproteobacteria bacterium]|nr:glutathione ABC transporter permease GsiC [Gammaproteobacteria bacterium]MBS04609.1 glutathione ABC transporter permease GsiC [Gammaproteobacteria bacterium]|tara:strand:+ start:254 stop:1216 length:963 start_codon:yes stop_codon:yes gene_type:complete